MGLLAPLLLSGLWAYLQAAATPDPLTSSLARVHAQGYVSESSVSTKFGQITLTGVIFRGTSPGKTNHLRVYASRNGRSRLLYMDPGAGSLLSFAPVHRGGAWTRTLDQEKIFLLYTKTFPGMGQEFLTILTFDGTLRAAPPIPFGRLEDVDQDGRPEIVARTLPLGAFVSVECGPFNAVTRIATRIVLYRWSKGRLAPISEKFPGYFERDIVRLEDRLLEISPRKSSRYADLLGLALSIYYDYETLGRASQGWDRLVELLRASPDDPPAAARCLRKIQADLERRLRPKGP